MTPAKAELLEPPDSRHDHGACVSDALEKAEALCADRGARLTPLRRRVLELIWASHRPVGAYDVLAELGGHGKPAAPPTVYRALDFLLEQGLIHRIASLNAFMGCARPGFAHNGEFLICRQCRQVVEVVDPQVQRAISASAAEHGFAAEAQGIEVTGLCRLCRGAAGAH